MKKRLLRQSTLDRIARGIEAMRGHEASLIPKDHCPIGAVSPGQIVYYQGHYKCEVVEDHGQSITYFAHQGAPAGGGPPKRWTASKDLFTDKKVYRKMEINIK